MRPSRSILLFVLIPFALVISWLWWAKPNNVDMATYAPADSLLYVEVNQPLEVVESIAATDAWRAFDAMVKAPALAPRSHFVQTLIRWTGIGPIQSVILARAQMAAVVTDLGTTEEGETLNVKPEGAIVIETHTSELRIRAPFEQAVRSFAEKTYGQPTARRITIEGVEVMEWSAPEGSRQIIAAIIGSLVIVGNSEHAVQNCLAVFQGRQPNLKGDPELARMRIQLGGEKSLAFGYVPAGSSARLLAFGLPAALGRAPGDSEFQRLIQNGAAKVFSSLGWTAKANRGGIEDRYLIGLQPPIPTRLKPNFVPANISSQLQRVVPDDSYSVTSYNFANPAAALQSLKSAVSSQVDAVSTILFSSLLKSSLLSYGIDDPESFLGAVSGELLTLRLDENDERSILIASVRDRATLRALVTRKMGAGQPGEQPGETFEDAHGEFAARFINNLVVMGAPADVRRYGNGLSNAESNTEKFKRMSFFATPNGTANVVTYTNDRDRVRSFVFAMIEMKGTTAVNSVLIEDAIAALPYSVTETTLGDHAIERTTRSPLGQFSSILPLLVPEQPVPRRAPTSK